MKFLLQPGVLLDFVFALQKAKEWWDWWRPKEDIIEFVDSGCSKVICPVGSLEFCLDYYEKLGLSLTPLNIPSHLFHYAVGYGMRKNSKISEWVEDLKLLSDGSDRLIDLDSPFYLKSETKFKYPGNGVYSSIRDFMNSPYYDPSDRYQITGYDPDLGDEWRYFVYSGEVVGMKCYLPDDILSPKVPEKGWILDRIKEIDLPAFTLDIAISGDGRPGIIEVHDFFSCGLYGFSDYSKLPYMLYRSHLHKFL